MGMKRLVEMCDENAKKEFGDYYIVSKSRMDNLIRCYEGQAEQIRNLSKIISDQQEAIHDLQKMILEDKDDTSN